MSRLIRLVAFGFLMLQGSQAWAGPAPDEIDKPMPPPSNRSDFNRQTQEIGLLASIGFRGSNLFFVDAGTEFAYFSQPNELLTVRISRLSANESSYGYSYDGNSFFDKASTLDLVGTAVSLNWKSFLSNSFYIKLGLEQFDVKGEYDEVGGPPRLHLGDLRRQNALFAIGNQWQWRVFTMGCDWGGLTYPLAHRYDSYHDEIDSSLARKFAEFGDKTLVNLLYFYLGASF